MASARALEERLLFSATPIDPGIVDAIDTDLLASQIQTSEETQADDSKLEQRTSTQSEIARSIVFINSDVPEIEALLDDLSDSRPDARVFVLDSGRDGVEQISEVLDQHNASDIHIVSHGENGAVRLGSTWLSASNLNGYAGQIAQWQSSLTSDADFQFYGCDLAETQNGRDLIDGIAALTSADIAASDDDTGHASLGGDWDLEYTTGAVESQVVFSSSLQNEWEHKLATITVNTFNDVVDGGDAFISLREAIIQANSTGDTIDLSTIGAGTFTLTINGTGEDSAATGDLDITGNVTITGLDASSTIIEGGGIDRVFDLLGNSARLTMSDVTVQGGSINDKGGGFQVDHASAVLKLDRVIVQNNMADDGAGIFNKGTINLTNVIISNNGDQVNTNEGGGIHNKETAVLNRVTLSGNKSDKGGGINHDNSANSLSLTNVTVSGNTAASSGGGLYSQNTATVVNSTFTLNVTDSGGGIRVQSGTTTISNTIVANNTAASANSDVQGNFDSQGFNLIQVVGSASGFIGSDLTGTGALLNSLADNGGFGATHSLAIGSAAINAGTTTGAPNIDQRGLSRDASPDIGAYEYEATIYAYDGFDYSTGSLEGQNGGTGWTTGWTTTAGSSADVNATGLTSPTSTLPTQGGNAMMNTSSQFTQVRDLATTLGTDGTTAWFSFLIQPDGIGAGGMSLVIGDGTGAKDLVTVGTNSNDFLITKNASAVGASFINNVLVDGQTYFLTVQIDFAAGNDTVTLYVDPTPGISTPDSVQTAQLTSADLGTFGEIGMIGGFSGNNTLFDELRVGTSFESVAPAIPNNSPTVANPIADQTATQDAAFNFQFASNVFNDGDGDTLTYTATLDDDSGLPTWLTFTGATRTFSGTPGNNDVGSIAVKVTADDGKGGTVSDEFSLVINDVNDAPTVSLTPVVSNLNENADTSSAITVATITVTDDLLGTETLSLSGADVSLFEIVGLDLRLKAGTSLNFETNASLDVTVEVDDSTIPGDPDDTASHSVAIGDINEAPTVSLTPVVSNLNENADTTSAIVVATITVTDDALGSETLSLSGDDAGLFEIVGSDLRLKAGTSLDFETNASLDVTVEVDDSTISGDPDDTASHSVSIGDINEAPTVSLTQVVSNLNENANTTSAIVVATITVTDDALGSETLTLSGDDAGLFEIVGSDLRLKAGTAIDFETNPTLNVTVNVDDSSLSGSPDDSASIAVTINNVTEAFTDTGEFRVNTTVGDEQNTIMSGRGSHQAVSVDSNGNYVVVWTSLNQDGSGQGVYARRFDSTGTPITGEVLVNATTNSDQQWASVVSAADGTFVVTWTDLNGSDEDVVYRRFSANGTAITGEIGVNTTTSGSQANSSIAMNRATGDFVIVWEGNGTQTGEEDSNGIFGQRFDSAGAAVGGEFRVNSVTTGGQSDAAVSMNASGDFVVSWDDGDGFHFQRFDNTGAEQGGRVTVDNSSVAGNGSIAMHSDGSLVVVWREGATGARDTFVQRFNNSGVAASTVQTVAMSTNNNQTDPSIAMDSTGAFVVVWEGEGTLAGQEDTSGVFVRKFDSNATAISNEFRVNETTAGVQGRASAAMLDTNNFVVVWSGNGDQTGQTDSIGVFAQQFGNATGNVAPTVANPIADRNATQDAPFSFTFANNTFHDSDGDTLTYSATLATGGSLPTWLAFNGGTRTFSGTPLNGDVGSITVRVTANDGNLNTIFDDFVLSVTDVNDPPTVSLSPVVSNLNENADTTTATVVATITVTDDAIGTETLSLSGDDASLFEIVGNDLRLISGATLDFETNPTLDVTVEVDDTSIAGTPDDTATHSIAIANVNEAPTLTLTAVVSSLPETTNTSSSIKVADLTINDDSLGTNVLSISGTDASLFELKNGNTELHLKAGVALDFENQSTLSVTVDLDDNTIPGTPDDTSTHTVAIQNENDPATGVPTITGEAITGQILTARTTAIEDQDGLGTFTYQWFRSGISIVDATDEQYTLTATDTGSQIHVAVSFLDGSGFTEGPLASVATPTVNIPVPVPPPSGRSNSGNSGGSGDSGGSESGGDSGRQSESSNEGESDNQESSDDSVSNDSEGPKQSHAAAFGCYNR